MKNTLLTFALMTVFFLSAGVAKAELVYDGKECNTDSYGNVTCRDKWHDSVTKIISYTNETVTKSTSVSETSTTTTTSTQAPIYNAGLPGFVSPLAAVAVALGGVSFLVKKKFSL